MCFNPRVQPIHVDDRDGVDIDAVEDFLDEEEVEGSEESEDEEEYTRPRVGGKGKGKGYGKGLGKGLGKGGKHASRGKTFAPKSISQVSRIFELIK